MPLLQPFVTPALVVLGAGIGAAVTSPPAVDEAHDVASTVQELRTDVPVGSGSAVVAGVSDATAALVSPFDTIALASSSSEDRF
ncbi:MAG: hypothetical protein ABWY45_02555 [Mycobacterium sp.]